MRDGAAVATAASMQKSCFQTRLEIETAIKRIKRIKTFPLVENGSSLISD